MPGILGRRIVSEAQRGLFGAELARRRKGLEPRMKGITTKQLEYDLREAAGKKLPERMVRKRRPPMRRR